MELSIYQGELERADVQALLAFHAAEMRQHSPPDACHVLPPAALDDADITLFSARDGGRLVGIGALRVLDGDAGEVKSMRSAPDAGRRGVGRAILSAILAEARARGCRELLLETGSGRAFAAANALYEGAGFTACGPFGGYLPSPFTRFLRLEL